MATQVQNVNKIQAGLCPHGLPPAACPICSQSMGGGGMRSDKPRRAGEMTYHECAMIGNMMRARELAKKEHENSLKQNLINAKAFEANLEKISQNLQSFITQLSKNFLTKPLALILNSTILPLTNFIQNLPRIIPQLIQNINNLRFEIQDKLNAIFGEAKAILEEKLSKLTQVLKENFPTLFKIFKKRDSKNDDNKIDEDKKIFNLKVLIKKIFKKKDEKNDNNHQNQ